jgi:uncharacterized membrane protein YidH (DUF202 family)
MSERGLHAERTRLAWRRTGAALAGIAVVLGRLAMPEMGSAAVIAGAAALAGASWTVLAASRPRRLARPPGIDQRLADSVLTDGRPAAIVTASVIVLCVLELAVAAHGGREAFHIRP